MDNAITGSCHCGGVSYEVSEKSQHSFICYCSDCQKINGGMRLVGEVFPKNSLNVSGEIKEYMYTGGIGDIHMCFCPECGTHLYAFPTSYPDIVVVRTSSLNDTNTFTPKEEMFSNNKCPWEK